MEEIGIYEDDCFKMILTARQIIDFGFEDHRTVTKLTGTKPYTLAPSIRVYDKEGEGFTIPAREGTVFLVSGTKHINAIPDHTELVVHLHDFDLRDIAEGQVIPQ